MFDHRMHQPVAAKTQSLHPHWIITQEPRKLRLELDTPNPENVLYKCSQFSFCFHCFLSSDPCLLIFSSPQISDNFYNLSKRVRTKTVNSFRLYTKASIQVHGRFLRAVHSSDFLLLQEKKNYILVVGGSTAWETGLDLVFWFCFVPFVEIFLGLPCLG